MDNETLRQEVSELAFGYVMSGRLSQDWLGQQLAPDQLPERFHDYSALVDLHVTLNPHIAAFAQNLRPHLRTIKTETRTEDNRSRDNIEGHIDWQQTYQQRYQETPSDRTLFITQRRTEEYDIPENLVLKKLLSVIYDTITELEDIDYGWLDERWNREASGHNEIQEFKRIYTRNVHLDRITTPSDSLPPRMIQATKSARKGFYRFAARGLEWRDKLLEGKPDALQAVFQSTVIEPSESTLFELFVLFRILEALEQRFGTTGRVRPISGSGNALAKTGTPPCYVYHNSSAKDRNLKFPQMPPPSDDILDRPHHSQQTDSEWLARSQTVHYWLESIRDQLWGSKKQTGKPDAIVFRPASAEQNRFVRDILIVEVKHSTNQETINEGIAETLRYVAYATKRTNPPEFLFPDAADEGAFGAEVHGLLVIQDYDFDTDLTEINGPIDIVQASDLQERLPSVLRDVFEAGITSPQNQSSVDG